MILYLTALIIGIAGLTWGADKFVEGASEFARHIGVSPIVIGLTIVSFGTSLPELLTTVTATFLGHPDVAVGNVVGSNLANIGLILGVASLFRPLTIHSSLLNREYLFLLLVSLVTWLMARDFVFSRVEGIVLLVGMAFFIWWMRQFSKQGTPNELLKDVAIEKESIKDKNISKPIFFLIMGLVSLTVGSRLLVWGGVGCARKLGVNELVIGLTLIAFGTSLPELATSIAGAIKKEDDIAVGNIIGSNIFNLLAILGIPATITPIKVSPDVFYRDFPVMLLATFVLWPICRSWKKGKLGRVNRIEGGALVLGYIIYIVYLFYK